ncbi:copper-binding protein [Caballeronia sp. GAWG1-1]|uniref:copper-binding protein n=1 Tax=Caballeronia sp. GAWG1-1 TaxID=2921742 RepID=UPI002028642D|nr:copper-binding protein [Caballeronia sp. GAWG1-1]
MSALLLGAPFAHANDKAQSGAATAVNASPAIGDAAVVQATAKITHVFADTNSVEIQDARGDKEVIAVDPSIADLKKLKVGDELHIQYRGAVLMTADKVDPKGVRSRVSASQRSPASEGVVVSTSGVQVVAVVQKIDPQTREVTLAGPKRVVTMKVSPDVSLDKLKVGDSVLATYMAATAVDVTRNGEIVK